MTSKRPIFAHPAIPFWGALWLAALVGLAVMVLPDWAIGRIVVAIRLDSVIPDLLPPLGLARHVALSLAAAVLAGLIGLALFLFVARMVGRRRRADWAELEGEMEPPPEDPVERMPRPLRVREELDEGFESEEPEFEHGAAAERSRHLRSDLTRGFQEANLGELLARFDQALDALVVARPAFASPREDASEGQPFTEPAAEDPTGEREGRRAQDRAQLRAALEHLARARDS